MASPYAAACAGQGVGEAASAGHSLWAVALSQWLDAVMERGTIASADEGESGALPFPPSALGGRGESKSKAPLESEEGAKGKYFRLDVSRSPVTAHAFSFTSSGGEPLPLAQFAGCALLLVNTAAHCGFARQLREMEALWQRYRGQGLMVLGVPSGDFGACPFATIGEIATYYQDIFGVTFPLTEKQRIIGAEAHPLFKWLGEQADGDYVPRWNFHKYLFDPRGTLVGHWRPPVTIDSPSFTTALERVLAGRRQGALAAP